MGQDETGRNGTGQDLMGRDGMKERRQDGMREGRGKEKMVKVIWCKTLSEADDL